MVVRWCEIWRVWWMGNQRKATGRDVCMCLHFPDFLTWLPGLPTVYKEYTKTGLLIKFHVYVVTLSTSGLELLGFPMYISGGKRGQEMIIPWKATSGIIHPPASSIPVELSQPPFPCYALITRWIWFRIRSLSIMIYCISPGLQPHPITHHDQTTPGTLFFYLKLDFLFCLLGDFFKGRCKTCAWSGF